MNRKLVYLLWFALWAMFAFVASGEITTYDADRRVPYTPDPAYERDEYHWWVRNTGQDSRLWLNGVYQSTETGTNDWGLWQAWQVQPHANGVKIGLVDVAGSHGSRMWEVLTNTAPGVQVTFYDCVRYNPWAVVEGIFHCLSNNCAAIVIGYGTGTAVVELSNACAQASMVNVPVFAPVIGYPNNIDVIPDYPSSWAHVIPLLMPIAFSNRTGNLHVGSGWGTNTLAAPGRNIVAQGTYESGTSYSAPMAAGVFALMLAHFPQRTMAELTTRMRESSKVIPKSRHIQPLECLRPFTPVNLSIRWVADVYETE